MSIVMPADRAEHWVPKERTSFYCGDLVAEDTIAVIWVAESGLLLHPDCARELGTHLICDSREVELASGRVPWTRRAARVAGAALAAEEGRS